MLVAVVVGRVPLALGAGAGNPLQWQVLGAGNWEWELHARTFLRCQLAQKGQGGSPPAGQSG